TLIASIRMLTRRTARHCQYKNKKIFGCRLFPKRRRLLKLFGKSFTKNLYNFRVLSSLTFQTVYKARKKDSAIYVVAGDTNATLVCMPVSVFGEMGQKICVLPLVGGALPCV
ncbi:hypothetical protein, partial [Novacetimonas hansenii]|uniref:hypothetical protein n=1 Tax=Novacetimonas hansenii TaxID=436 RepID=UPI0039EC9724